MGNKRDISILNMTIILVCRILALVLNLNVLM